MTSAFGRSPCFAARPCPARTPRRCPAQCSASHAARASELGLGAWIIVIGSLDQLRILGAFCLHPVPFRYTKIHTNRDGVVILGSLSTTSHFSFSHVKCKSFILVMKTRPARMKNSRKQKSIAKQNKRLKWVNRSKTWFYFTLPVVGSCLTTVSVIHLRQTSQQ